MTDDIALVRVEETLKHLNTTVSSLDDTLKEFNKTQDLHSVEMATLKEKQKVANNRLNALEADRKKLVIWFICAIGAIILKEVLVK
jgi:chromosome segregation ATPase